MSPARWTLSQALIDVAGDADRWETELDRWRTDIVLAPPPTVLTEDDDRQLPLTLDRSDDRQLLRRHVRRGLTGVTELPGGHDTTSAVTAGPHGRHLTELVIPVIRHAGPAASRHHAAPPARARGEGLFHPGGPWLSLAIPTPPHLQDELLRPPVRAADTDDDQRPGGSELLLALHDRLTAYRDVLPAHLRATCASSLIHMHANRALPSADDEPLIRALAADLVAPPPASCAPPAAPVLRIAEHWPWANELAAARLDDLRRPLG